MHIDSYDFGRFVVDGTEYKQDIRIINNKISLWQDHGLSLDDVLDAVEAKPEIIIIGTGASGVVQVSEEIKNFIESKGINLIIKITGEACNEFNKLTEQGKKVAAVLHSTC